VLFREFSPRCIQRALKLSAAMGTTEVDGSRHDWWSHRQGSARPDRVAPRPAKTCCCRYRDRNTGQSSGGVSHRAAHRRAARGSDRDGAHGEGEVVPRSSMSLPAATCKVAEMRDRKGQAFGRAKKTWFILTRSITRPGARTTPWCEFGTVLTGGCDGTMRCSGRRAFFGAARKIEEGGASPFSQPPWSMTG